MLLPAKLWSSQLTTTRHVSRSCAYVPVRQDDIKPADNHTHTQAEAAVECQTGNWVIVAYIYNALCDGLIDSIKDELVVDVLLVAQGRSCPSQLQVVIQLCIVTILPFKVGTQDKHTKYDWTLGSAQENPWVQSKTSLLIYLSLLLVGQMVSLSCWESSQIKHQDTLAQANKLVSYSRHSQKLRTAS